MLTLYISLIIIPLALGIWAQMRVTHAYKKWSKVRASSGITGAQAAKAIMERAGILDVAVEAIPGHLTDHYDPARRVLAP